MVTSCCSHTYSLFCFRFLVTYPPANTAVAARIRKNIVFSPASGKTPDTILWFSIFAEISFTSIVPVVFVVITWYLSESTFTSVTSYAVLHCLGKSCVQFQSL